MKTEKAWVLKRAGQSMVGGLIGLYQKETSAKNMAKRLAMQMGKEVEDYEVVKISISIL